MRFRDTNSGLRPSVLCPLQRFEGVFDRPLHDQALRVFPEKSHLPGIETKSSGFCLAGRGSRSIAQQNTSTNAKRIEAVSFGLRLHD